jgi:hypothetical protein
VLANAFINRPTAPGESDLAEALGPAKALWDCLAADLIKECALDGQEWKSYSLKYGWSLRLTRKKRNILYLSPCKGSFHVMFILGEKAMTAVRACRLSQRMQAIIKEAPKYPEGTGIRIERAGRRDVPAIKKLAQIKLQY